MADWEKRYTDLVRILSHDLRAPLRHVVSFTELLLDRREDLDEKNQQWLDYVRSSGELAQAMLMQMLEFSRVFQTDATPTTIEIASWAGRYAAKSNLECSLEVTAGSTVRADEDRLTQALDALVENAREFGGETTLRVVAGNDSIEVRVEQSENELPAEKWEAACQPFGRVGQRPTLEHLGMGLPLAVALAESFGGEVKQCEGGAVISLPTSASLSPSAPAVSSLSPES